MCEVPHLCPKDDCESDVEPVQCLGLGGAGVDRRVVKAQLKRGDADDGQHGDVEVLVGNNLKDQGRAMSITDGEDGSLRGGLHQSRMVRMAHSGEVNDGEDGSLRHLLSTPMSILLVNSPSCLSPPALSSP